MDLDPATWEEVCRRRRAGESLSSLSEDYAVSKSTLLRKLRAAGCTPDTQGPKNQAAAAAAPDVPARRKTTRNPHVTRGPAKRAARPRSTRAARRRLIDRLYRAIDTKLKLMERRMNNEIEDLDASPGELHAGEGGSASAGRTSADHERETRAFGALVKTINSVRQLQAELDTVAHAQSVTAQSANGQSSNGKPSDADARLAADAERYRRDIAERLAKFIPPQS